MNCQCHCHTCNSCYIAAVTQGYRWLSWVWQPGILCDWPGLSVLLFLMQFKGKELLKIFCKTFQFLHSCSSSVEVVTSSLNRTHITYHQTTFRLTQILALRQKNHKKNIFFLIQFLIYCAKNFLQIITSLSSLGFKVCKICIIFSNYFVLMVSVHLIFSFIHQHIYSPKHP